MSYAENNNRNQKPVENPKIIGNYMIGIYNIFCKYLKGKTIGEGTFGKVKLGIHLPTEEKVLNINLILQGCCQNTVKK
jgi:hypothetical protein